MATLLRTSVPRPWGVGAVALAGACAAAAVGYLTSQNPAASPAHAAVVLRVVIILALIGTGLYATTDPIQARMGRLLLGAGFFSVAWLLNGAHQRALFTIGVISAGLAPTVFAYVMLAHPAGRLASAAEKRFLAAAAGVLMLSWTYFVVTKLQLPFKTPLLQCVPHCPRGLFSITPAPTAVDPALKVAATVAWAAVACAPPLFILHRVRSAAPPVRRTLIPVGLAALASALLSVAFLISRAAGATSTSGAGAAYVATAAVIPVAILTGLVLERLFMGRALAEFTTDLVQNPTGDPALMMARALGDPSLTIVYERPNSGSAVDFSGAEVIAPEADAERAVVWVERNRDRVAAVTYDAKLAAQARFVQAAGAAAIMRLEEARLEADLRGSTGALAASRMRLVEAADMERQRIERDIHDGVQQQLVALRIKLELAADTLNDQPARAQEMIATIGRQMDDVLDGLRSLARGIYPSILPQRGLADALRSAAQRAPVPVLVRAQGLERYAEEVEAAVYFCCLEAMQNVAKHAGPGAEAAVRLREDGRRLEFEVTDTGIGFDPRSAQPGSGLVNMKDRIEAIGGRLTIRSRRGDGTSICGVAPAAPPGRLPTPR
jgi:signal transduction histidine kinase